MEARETHSRPVPGGRAYWWTESLWQHAAGLPVTRVGVDDVPELDLNCWFHPGTGPTCRDVARHAERIQEADLSFPVILSADGGLMDGGHRLAKAWLSGQQEVSAVRFVQDPEPDWFVPDVQTPSVARHAPAGYACPFCLYAAGGSNDLAGQAHVVERTDQTLTLVSPKWWPGNEGHLLVVPRRHVEALYELPHDLAGPLQLATQRAALALKRAYDSDGTSTRQHNEPGGDQDVWHYHVHVFPRFAGDRLYSSQGEYVDQALMSQYAERVRQAYAQLDAYPSTLPDPSRHRALDL